MTSSRLTSILELCRRVLMRVFFAINLITDKGKCILESDAKNVFEIIFLKIPWNHTNSKIVFSRKFYPNRLNRTYVVLLWIFFCIRFFMMCIPRNILAKWQSGHYDRFYHHICISVSFYLNWGQIEFFAYITYINNKKVFMTYL